MKNFSCIAIVVHSFFNFLQIQQIVETVSKNRKFPSKMPFKSFSDGHFNDFLNTNLNEKFVLHNNCCSFIHFSIST